MKIDGDMAMELLGIYMDLVQLQDEVIFHQQSVIRNQSDIIKQMEATHGLSLIDVPGLEDNMRAAEEAMKRYDKEKMDCEV